MATLDFSIPFAGGQQPSIVNALAMGQQAGQAVVDNRYQADYRNALSQYGAGAMNGDQTAMNALAGYDPAAMQGLQAGRQSMDTQQAQNQRQIEEHLATLDANGRAEVLARGQQVVGQLMQAQTPEQWDALATRLGKPELVGHPEMLDGLIAQYSTLEQNVQRMDQRNAPVDPMDAIRLQQAQVDLKNSSKPEPVAPPTFRPATPEEAAQGGATAGQIDMATGRFYPNDPPSGMSITTGPNGTTITQGPGAGTAAAAINPYNPAAMIGTINQILTDPALAGATGMDAARTRIPGSPERGVGARMDQLEGQAFLQAFDSLKGAGQITEIEGQKATQAIGALDRFQSQRDYEAALIQLRRILANGATRPPGWATSPEGIAYDARTAQTFTDPIRGGPSQGAAVAPSPTDFSAMTPADLGQVNVMELDMQGLAAYNAAIDALGSQ